MTNLYRHVSINLRLTGRRHCDGGCHCTSLPGKILKSEWKFSEFAWVVTCIPYWVKVEPCTKCSVTWKLPAILLFDFGTCLFRVKCNILCIRRLPSYRWERLCAYCVAQGAQNTHSTLLNMQARSSMRYSINHEKRWNTLLYSLILILLIWYAQICTGLWR